MSIDALLAAHLERTSLSPRGRFVGALNSNNLDAIIYELRSDTSECTPLVLAACLFAIMPKAEEVPDVVADVLLQLSNRLVTSEKCSYKSWEALLVLLCTEGLKPENLADFLSKTEAETDSFDDTFLAKTWTSLSKCFKLHRFPSILDKVPITDWINSYFLAPEEPILVLLLIYYSCSHAQEDFNKDQMVQVDGCRQFLLKSIRHCAILQNSFPMVEIILQNDLPDFMELSSRETLLHLSTFYETQKSVDFSFVCRLISKLQRPDDDPLIKAQLTKEWTLDPFNIEENQPDYIPLIASLLQKVPESAEKCVDLFLTRYVQFSQENRSQLQRLSARMCDFRIRVSILIKERLIKTLFFIYNHCADKQSCFERLEKVLMETRVTLQSPEPKVLKLLEEDAQHLIYQQKRITLGKSTLL